MQAFPSMHILKGCGLQSTIEITYIGQTPSMYVIMMVWHWYEHGRLVVDLKLY